MDQNGQSNGTVMALMGCGGLLIVGLCILTGIGGYMFLAPSSPTAPVIVTPATPGVPPPQPFPQPQQPPQPFPTPQPQQPALPPPPQPARPNLRVRATITFVTPGGPVPSGANCDFQVEMPAAGSEMCRAQVYCGSRLLYGGANAGFFPCTPGPGAHVTGQDGDTTSNDTDASFTISTPASIITIRDDASGANGAFTITAHVDSVQ